MKNIYKEKGYKNREDYLKSLVDEFSTLDYITIKTLADVLGPNEDFDGLINQLEDLDYSNYSYEDDGRDYYDGIIFKDRFTPNDFYDL